MLITGNRISGATIGGRTNDTGMVSAHVGGVDIKFQPGADLAQRQVNLLGMMSITIGPGFSQSMNLNGVDIKAQNGDLWVNGEKVNFSGTQAAAEPAAEAPGDALKDLEVRYPGVQFFGNPSAAHIDDSVKMEPGATVELNPGLYLLGSTKLDATARISGGVIADSWVKGEVRGGMVQGSQLGAGSLVTSGSVVKSVLESGSTVNGGHVEHSALQEGATVNGGNVAHMCLDVGSKVKGGNLENFTLAAGKTINSGNHDGGISEGVASPSVVVGGSSVVVGGSGGVVLGGTVTGSNVVISTGDVVSGLRGGSFDASTSRQMSSFSAFAGELDAVVNQGR
jgi:hypothetical protein